jgi:hypothetical protein
MEQIPQISGVAVQQQTVVRLRTVTKPSAYRGNLDLRHKPLQRQPLHYLPLLP